MNPIPTEDGKANVGKIRDSNYANSWDCLRAISAAA
jgi:hypothetical protein